MLCKVDIVSNKEASVAFGPISEVEVVDFKGVSEHPASDMVAKSEVVSSAHYSRSEEHSVSASMA